MITYEQQLSNNLDWALREGSMHFEENNAVHKALKQVTRRLEELQIPYAVAGAMSMFAHGFRRFTDDVDILVGRESLGKIHEKLEGLGYVAPFAGSKNLHDAELGVRVEFLVAGEYPGDGKPKPVAFPDPLEAGEVIQGIRYLRLPRLVEMKLASGMTNAGRLKDLADVQEIIRELGLGEDYADHLNPFVRAKFRELWAAVKNNP